MIFDTEAFDVITAGDREIAIEMACLYREDSEDLLKQLETAKTAGNDGEIRRLAHTLKSSSGAMGAMAASELAATLEHDGSSVVADVLPRLVEVVHAAVQELDRYVATVGA